MTDDLRRELEIDPTELEPEQPEPEVEPEAPATVEIDGQQVAVDDLGVYYRTMQWATAHPEQWEQIQEWERRGYVLDEHLQPHPQVQAPEPTYDDEDEYVDPRVRALEDRLEAYESQILDRQHAEDRQSIDAGLEAFLQEHDDLTEDERNQVLIEARDWLLVPAAVEREQNPARRSVAVQKAFERAYRMVFFDRAGQQAADKVVTNISRARRAATATSARPAPRTRPEPKIETARDMENALREALEEAAEANR